MYLEIILITLKNSDASVTYHLRQIHLPDDHLDCK